MQKEKIYESTVFSADVLLEAHSVWKSQVDQENGLDIKYQLWVQIDDAQWGHDTLQEFVADYRKSLGYAYFVAEQGIVSELKLHISGSGSDRNTHILVSATDRSRIESVFDVFEKNLERSKLPQASVHESQITKPKVFIGHGGDSQWRDLKDHLQDQHGFEVVAYEIGARAGHAIRDILENMLSASDIAMLVMTGEDETISNELNPRLNVVHELGLFQGRLGFSRGIALLEEGANEFTNINGIQQIRFSKGNIRETFGDVLATLRREFPTESDE